MVQFLHPGETNQNAANGDDIERRASTARSKSVSSVTAFEGMDEYSALQKFITLYRDPRQKQLDEGYNAADAGKDKKWWQFWRAGTSPNAKPQDTGVAPEGWLDTDIRQGITSAEVENRRKRAGFNEITTEKTNLLKQFLSYFMGPILYGTDFSPRFDVPMLTVSAKLWKLLLFWLPVSRIGSILVSFAVFCCLTLLSVGIKKSKLPMSSLA